MPKKITTTIYTITLLLITLSCSFQKSSEINTPKEKEISLVKDQKIAKDKTNSNSDIEELNCYNNIKIKPKIFRKENLCKINYKFETFSIDIYLFEEGYSYLKYLDVLYQTEFNFSYDVVASENIKKIIIYKPYYNSRKLIFALPTYTEEFETYQLIEFNNNSFFDKGNFTYSYKQFKKINTNNKYNLKLCIENEKIKFYKEDSGGNIIYFDLTFENEISNDSKNEILKKVTPKISNF